MAYGLWQHSPGWQGRVTIALAIPMATLLSR